MFVAGKYCITGEQIRTQPRWCAAGAGGHKVKRLWSVKISHLTATLRTADDMIDRVTCLWLPICFLRS